VPLLDVFRQNPSLQEQAAEQGVRPVRSVQELAASEPIEDEEVEAFLEVLKNTR